MQGHQVYPVKAGWTEDKSSLMLMQSQIYPICHPGAAPGIEKQDTPISPFIYKLMKCEIAHLGRIIKRVP